MSVAGVKHSADYVASFTKFMNNLHSITFSLGGFQFVNQGILFLQILLYIFHCS